MNKVSVGDLVKTNKHAKKSLVGAWRRNVGQVVEVRGCALPLSNCIVYVWWDCKGNPEPINIRWLEAA